MGLFGKLKGTKQPENRNGKELHNIKRALSTNGKKPDIKISKNIGLSYDTFTTRHNTNVLLLGGDDVYKRTVHIEPNIAAFDRNFIITDVDSSLYEKYAGELESRGYTVNYIDMDDLKKSNYNPIGYIYNEDDARRFSEDIIENLEDEIIKDSSKGMWENAELNILSAVVAAIAASKENGCMKDVVEVLEGGISALDELFASADTKTANEYSKFKWDISPETQKGITLTLASKLQSFKTWDSGMTSEECTSDTKEYVFGKKALFIKLPEKKGMILTPGVFIHQMFSAITGEMVNLGILRPQYPLQFVFNGMDKVGKICCFDEILESAESQTFAFSIFAPSIDSISNIFEDKWNVILSHCDTAVCLAKNDENVIKWMIDEFDSAETVQDSSYNDEIFEAAKNLDNDSILVRVRGFNPVTDNVATSGGMS